MTIFIKHSILDVWQGSEYASVYTYASEYYLSCFVMVLRGRHKNIMPNWL